MQSTARLVALLFAMLVSTLSFGGTENSPPPAPAASAAQTVVVTPSRAMSDEELFAPVATTESFKLGSEYRSLWAYTLARKLPRKDWPAYWKEASTLSKIPHTDEAWRKLPVDAVITVPRDPNAIRLEMQARIDAVKQLREELASTKASIVELKRVNDELAALQNQMRTANYVLIALVVVLLAALVRLAYRYLHKERKAKGDKKVRPLQGKDSASIAPSDHIIHEDHGWPAENRARESAVPATPAPHAPDPVLDARPAEPHSDPGGWKGFPTSREHPQAALDPDASSLEQGEPSVDFAPYPSGSPVARNELPDPIDLVFEGYDEIEPRSPKEDVYLGRARGKENGEAYWLNQDTLGFNRELRPGDEFSAMVTETPHVVTKILRVTPLKHQPDAGRGSDSPRANT